ncbi:Uncharacterised protein [Mycobacteroides abscessus subsp. abscessus]|nr:Uncharacterised protein [Mycobacteroides abscessus subsp. abscessus]
MRLQTSGSVGAANCTCAAYDSNSSRIGSSNSEWKAWLVSSQVQRIPSSWNRATACSRSSPGPESTVLGPL